MGVLVAAALIMACARDVRAATTSLVGGIDSSYPRGDIAGAPFQGVRGSASGLLFDVYSKEGPMRIGPWWLAIELPIPISGGIELGVLYLDRRFRESGTASELSAPFVQVPVSLHLTYFKLISFGVGAYYARSVGFMYPSSAQSPSVLMNSRRDEGGLLVHARLHLFPLSPIGLWLEGRASGSLTTLADAGDFRFGDAQALLGLRLGKLE